jgi:HK97 family phage prohead protease
MKLKHKPNEVEVRSAPLKELRIATAEDGTHTVTGYALVCNSQSVDLGGFIEVVAPSALTRTLLVNPDVLCLRDHKQELLLGRTTSGTLSLSADANGLQFTCLLPATSSANDLAESLRRGDIDSCSFGFTVVKDVWTFDAQGNDIRTLLDLDLFEISIVSFPAYESTTAALRSAPLEVRTRVNARRIDKVCLCECPECVDGDCSDCSDSECNDELCSCDNTERSLSLRHKRSVLNLRLYELTSNTL